jgi:predicted membrane chloride channel (bestrophin family)
MKISSTFQFGIGRLLVLMTVVAGISALSVRIAGPSLFQSVVAMYFIMLAIWIVMRVPSLYDKFRELRKRSHQIAEHRLALERDLVSVKQTVDRSKGAAQPEHR